MINGLARVRLLPRRDKATLNDRTKLLLDLVPNGWVVVISEMMDEIDLADIGVRIGDIRQTRLGGPRRRLDVPGRG